MSKSTLVVVANSSRARVLRAENNNELSEVDTFEHPESRAEGHELGTSAPGTTFDRVGQNRHSYESPTSLKKQEAIAFAREIAQYLEKTCNGNGVEKLYLVANPTFLGLLRRHLHQSVAKLILDQIPKDVTAQNAEEIRKHLPYVL